MSDERKSSGFNPPLTALDPETIALVNRAIEELRKRKVSEDYCPRCDTRDWNVEPVAISVIPLMGVPAALPSAYFPAHIMAILIVCKNCGYTMLHNLNVLGLAQVRPSY